MLQSKKKFSSEKVNKMLILGVSCVHNIVVCKRHADEHILFSPYIYPRNSMEFILFR